MQISTNSQLDLAISDIISENFLPFQTLNKCFIHLITIISNLLDSPNELRFNVIKHTNENIFKEVLLFPKAVKLLYLIGFEDLKIDGILSLIYTRGFENTKTLEKALQILRNKQKNEILNFPNEKTHKKTKQVKIEKKNLKENHEKITMDFEHFKNYNLEIKKSISRSSDKEKPKPLKYKRSNFAGTGSCVGSNIESSDSRIENFDEIMENLIKKRKMECAINIKSLIE